MINIVITVQINEICYKCIASFKWHLRPARGRPWSCNIFCSLVHLPMHRCWLPWPWPWVPCAQALVRATPLQPRLPWQLCQRRANTSPSLRWLIFSTSCVKLCSQDPYRFAAIELYTCMLSQIWYQLTNVPASFSKIRTVRHVICSLL